MSVAHIWQSSSEDLYIIEHLAKEIWPHTFANILTPEQIAYMLKKMYSVQVLKTQQQAGSEFYIASVGVTPVGYFNIEHLHDEKQVSTKLHKIYLLPSQQGSGIGKQMLQAAIDYAQQNGSSFFYLNVNKYNKAIAFYESQGLSILHEEDIDIGEGYWMNDFVMGMKI
jgi:diamine N-acetyltransferase